MPYRVAVRHSVSYRIRRLPTFAAVLVGSFTIAIILTWLLGLDARYSFRATVMSVKANAAVALLFEACMLGLLTRKTEPRFFIWLLLPPVCIATLTLVESFGAWTAGIDQLFSLDKWSAVRPGQISPLTAMSLLTLAIAQFLVLLRRTVTVIASQILSLLLLSATILALLGHLYNAPGLYHVGSSAPIAVPTAACLASLALGTLFLRPTEGFLVSLSLDSVSGRMGRRLLFAAITILPSLAWLRVKGQELDLYDSSIGTSLVIVSAMIMFAFMIGIHTKVMVHAEDRIQYLNRVYSMLSEINSLIVRTTNRDDLLKGASHIAISRGGFLRAWFGLIDRECNVIRLVYGIENSTPPTADDPRLSLLDLGAGYSPIGLAVNNRRPVVSNDVAADAPSHFTQELLANGIHSYAVFPLLIGSRVLGVFKLHADVPNFFHREELQLLGEMAGDVAFAIRHLEHKQAVEHLAYFDALTGLANARLLEDRLRQAIEHACQTDSPLSLIVIDIIAFKMVNDAFGRNVGDEALRMIARRLGAECGDHRCARLGSNLFAILLPSFALESEIAQEYERIRQSVFETLDIHGQVFSLATRAGIAMVPVDGKDPLSLLRIAESALESARQTGLRYRFHAHSSNTRVAEQMNMRRLLASALAKDEFSLHYQVKIDGKSGSPVSAEALLRWNSAEYGTVSPSTFVPILEETGLIENVGLWAFAKAAQDSYESFAGVAQNFRVAVNVSVSQLRRTDFIDAVTRAFGPYAAKAQLDVEITESLIMHDLEDAIDKLRALRKLGFKIAIDDFGTGYSSLAYLARLPLDYLKIDRSFVSMLPDSIEGTAVVNSIVSLARSLKLSVIAEGVETAAQAELLTSVGCDQLQGYYYGRPEPLDDLLTRLKARTLPSVRP